MIEKRIRNSDPLNQRPTLGGRAIPFGAAGVGSEPRLDAGDVGAKVSDDADRMLARNTRWTFGDDDVVGT